MIALRLIVMSMALGLTLAASAGSALEVAAPPDPVCPLPVSTCRVGPIPLDSLGSTPLPAPAECPDGYQCVCVPSCPACRDCAAQVCVAGRPAQCQSACDCEAGLACLNGQCLAGFMPVFCCEGNICPLNQQCQHHDGTMDRCSPLCIDELWLCGFDGETAPCGADRTCACTSPYPPCPACMRPEVCGPPVCVPPETPTLYHCSPDGTCANPGDRCVCASSCPGCDDCPLAVCVPDRCEDPMCEERVRKVTDWIGRKVERASRCEDSAECVRVDTSTECLGTCGAWVNRSFERYVRKAIRLINHRVCATYLEDGCPFATTACVFERGACVKRRCVGLPGLLAPESGEPITVFMPFDAVEPASTP